MEPLDETMTQEEQLEAGNLYLCAENAYLENECLGFRTGKARMRTQATVILQLRQEYPLELRLKLAKLPQSSAYLYS